jgi:hypothetical protein
MQTLTQGNNKVVAVNIHQGDWLSNTAFFNQMNLHLGGVNGYPRATINRTPALYGTQVDSVVISIFNWRPNIIHALAQPAIAGLAMKSEERNNYAKVTLFIASTVSLDTNHRVTVYVIEDNIKAKNQLGADSNYLHPNVVREVLTLNTGSEISMSASDVLQMNFEHTLPADWNKNNLYYVAVLHKMGNSTQTREVLNSLKCPLGTTKKWNE